VSQIRFYTDEHVSKAVIRALRRRSVDVLTVPEAGLLSASDEEHLQRASHEGRVIFTQDDDFLRLAAEVEHPGVVYAAQETPVRAIISGLLLVH
jgi:predicted nuclease of predicted toxin-antitoxin system